MAVSLPKVSQDFEADVEDYLAEMDRLIAKNRDVIESIGDVKAAIDALDGKTIDIDINKAAILADIAEVKTELDALDDVSLAVTLDLGRLTSSINSAKMMLKSLTDINIPVTLDLSGLVSSINTAKMMLKALLPISIPVTLDLSGLASAIAAAKMMLRSLTSVPFSINIIFNWGGILAQVALLKALLGGMFTGGIGGITNSFNTFLQVINNVTRATQQAGTAAGAATGAFRLFGLSAQAIHMIIMGTFEFLAVFIPAMIALGAAVAVQLEGWQDLYTRMNAVNTVGQSLGGAFNTTTGKMLGMGDALQKAQTAMDPQVFEFLGAAINGVNISTSKSHDLFLKMGEAATTAMDAFAAKIDVDLNGGMNQFTGLINKGVTDLIMFGQILGNIGHALLNFASAMPGLAEVLLRIIDGISGVLLWLSKLPPMFLTVVFGIEEAYRWSGALVSIFGLLGKAITMVGTLGIPVFAKIGQNVGQMAASVITGVSGMIGNLGKLGTTIGESLGKDMSGAEQEIAKFRNTLGDAAAFMTGPWGAAIGLGAVALGALVVWMANTKSATQQWVGSLEDGVNAAKGLSQVGQTYQSLYQVTGALAGSQKQLAQAQQQGSSGWSEFLDTVKSAIPFMGGASNAIGDASVKTDVLSQAQRQLSTDFTTEIGNVQLIADKYKIGYVQAAILAGNAGANLTQTMKGNSAAAQQNLQMVENYVTGLGGMASAQGTLGASVNALTVAADLQSSKIQQLTQAWSTVMSMVQGPSNGFNSIRQSLDQFNSDAAVTGARMTGLGGAATATTRNVTDATTKLQGDFNNTVSSMQTYTNSLMTAAAVTGNSGPLIQGIKDQIAILVPMAGNNKNAAAQVKVLWQEAGGSASDSLKQIGTAVSGIKNPLQDLQTLTGNVSLSLANLGQDSQNLAQVITTTLNQSLTTMAYQLTGVDKAMGKYLTDLQNNAPLSQTAADQAALNSDISTGNNLVTTAGAGITALSGKQQSYGATVAAQQANRETFNKDTADILAKAPSTAAAIAKLGTAIQDSGTKSSATAGARAQLIKDLEASGVKAQTATTYVDNWMAALSKLGNSLGPIITSVNNLGKAIQNLPSTKYVTIVEKNTAYAISAGGAASPHATGGRIPGFGGGDIVPAMLEPGEAIVPKHLVSAVAPFLGAHKVPGFAAGGMVAPMLPPVPDTTGLALLQQQLTGLGGDVTKDTTQVAAAALVSAKAQAALTAAQGVLNTDEADIKTIDAKITAAKALDTKAAATLKAAEKAESTAKSHVTALEKLYPTYHNEMALAAAKNVYNAAASKVTKDKAALAAAAKLVSSDESILSTAKSKEVSAAANYLNMQRLQRNDETALALAQLDQKQTSTQLSQLQTIQAGGAGISSMNDLLLPGTPLSTLAAAMPGVGLAWGAPAVAAAAAVPPLPVNSFDSGGYLPQGLSLAMNNTGAPEPVGGAGGEIHNHISVHLDGQQIQQSVQKSTLRYNIRNNGLATGLMKPR